MKVFRLDESSTQLHQALFDDLFVSADGGKSVLEQMVKKMESDHNFTDEDNKDRNERRLEQMVAAIAKNMVRLIRFALLCFGFAYFGVILLSL